MRTVNCGQKVNEKINTSQKSSMHEVYLFTVGHVGTSPLSKALQQTNLPSYTSEKTQNEHKQSRSRTVT